MFRERSPGNILVVYKQISMRFDEDGNLIPYSRETLKNCRRFYLEYKDRILNRGGAVRYLSSDPTIATVDENGKVTARKAGTVTITVTASNGVTATV